MAATLPRRPRAEQQALTLRGCFGFPVFLFVLALRLKGVDKLAPAITEVIRKLRRFDFMSPSFRSLKDCGSVFDY